MILWLLACQSPEKIPEDTSFSELVEAFAFAGADFSVEVGQTALFDASNSTGTYFEWNFGDGQTATGSTSTHSYTEAGHYQAVLTAFASDGSRNSDVVLVTVHNPIVETASSFSNTIAVTDTAIWTILEEGNQLNRLDLTDLSLQQINICEMPRTLAIHSGIIAVACQKNAQLALYDIDQESISYIDLPANSAPYGVAGRTNSWWISLSATGQFANYSNGTVELIDVGPDPRGITVLTDGRVVSPRWRSVNTGGEIYIWDNDSLQKIELDVDTSGDSDNTTGGIPNLLDIAIPSPDGKELFVPMLHSNTLRGLYQNSQSQNHETSLRAILARPSLDQYQENVTDRKQFDERGRASAIALSPLGDYAYVLHPSTGTITILDAFNQQLVGSILNIGNMPTGIALDTEGNTLYVYAWLDRQVLAYDLSSKSQPEHLWTQSICLEEPLAPAVLLGKQIFHNASDTRITRSGYISCSNCHPDATHDGQTWDFTQRGEGMRNTTSLLGSAGTGMGRFHWTGNFDEIQDFENDIREEFAGSGFLTDEEFEETSDTLGPPKAGRSVELDALASYIFSLDESPPSPYDEDSLGEELFHSNGCAECHPPPLYTDSTITEPIRHDVGTITEASGARRGDDIDGFDTPTLLGIWHSPPYLHDGSANTLLEAILAHQQYENISEEIGISIAQFLKSL